MGELWWSLRAFCWGVVKRCYYAAPAILFDPFDIYNKYLAALLPQSWHWEGVDMLPATWFPYVLLGGLFLAAVLTFHELRKRESVLRIELNTKYNADVRAAYEYALQIWPWIQGQLQIAISENRTILDFKQKNVQISPRHLDEINRKQEAIKVNPCGLLIHLETLAASSFPELAGSVRALHCVQKQFLRNVVAEWRRADADGRQISMDKQTDDLRRQIEGLHDAIRSLLAPITL